MKQGIKGGEIQTETLPFSGFAALAIWYSASIPPYQGFPLSGRLLNTRASHCLRGFAGKRLRLADPIASPDAVISQAGSDMF